MVAWREFISPKILREEKGFQDEPNEEKVLPPNGHYVSHVLITNPISLLGSCLHLDVGFALQLLSYLTMEIIGPWYSNTC